jgi:hypothetical protein
VHVLNADVDALLHDAVAENIVLIIIYQLHDLISYSNSKF